MQRTDILIQQRDTNPHPGGYADVAAAVGVDIYHFPRTPEAQRHRRKVAVPARAETPEALRLQQIDSATKNAFSHFQEQPERVFTNDEVRGYAQWILQANTLLETMRVAAAKGEQ